MNINVSMPNLIPNTLHPPTESIRRDNQRREVITQPKEAQAYAKEPEVGAEKDRTKPRHLPQYPNAEHSPEHERIDEREHHQARQQGGQKEEQDPDQEPQGQQQSGQQQLSESEQSKVDELKARDQEVRQHEQQHQAAGGQYASSPSYSYEQGPDGKRYAVGGEVSIDTSVIAGDPDATITKMRQVQRAATAPAQPSSQDRQVAAQAQSKMQQAQQQKQALDAQTGDVAASTTSVEQADNDPHMEEERFIQAQASAANALREQYPDISKQMQQRNNTIAQRYVGASAVPEQASLSLRA